MLDADSSSDDSLFLNISASSDAKTDVEDAVFVEHDKDERHTIVNRKENDVEKVIAEADSTTNVEDQSDEVRKSVSADDEIESMEQIPVGLLEYSCTDISQANVIQPDETIDRSTESVDEAGKLTDEDDSTEPACKITKFQSYSSCQVGSALAGVGMKSSAVESNNLLTFGRFYVSRSKESEKNARKKFECDSILSICDGFMDGSNGNCLKNEQGSQFGSEDIMDNHAVDKKATSYSHDKQIMEVDLKDSSLNKRDKRCAYNKTVSMCIEEVARWEPLDDRGEEELEMLTTSHLNGEQCCGTGRSHDDLAGM